MRIRKILRKLIFSFVLFLSLINVSAKTNVYVFYNPTCPHCKEEIEFLQDYKKEHDIEVILKEVTKNKANRKLLQSMKEKLDIHNHYVPFTIVGSSGITGYTMTSKANIIASILECEENGCNDIVAGEEIELKNQNRTFKLPILGSVSAKEVSLPLMSIILGFIDGFNPCAMWVLLFLLSMLLPLKDRKKMWVIGFTFLFTSGLIYAIFMSAILQITISFSTIFYVRIFLGFFALLGGVLNIRSYIKTRKEVGCEVTNKKTTLIKIQNIVKSKSLLVAILGAILLAISVNFIELSCSAGFPVIFTTILSLNQVSTLSYLFYIILYILFYMLDDIIIFTVCMITFKLTGISNKYSKISKIVGGILMFVIGILLIFFPSILMFNF